MPADVTPSISVVVPAFNAEATLAVQLDALLAQATEIDYEIIVVDNNSTDSTSQIIKKYSERDSRIRLCVATRGKGPSYARNEGIAVARSERIACCDADDVVAANWISSMHAALTRHCAVSGVLEVASLNHTDVVAARGSAVAGRAGDFSGVTFAHGANFGIRKATYDAVGGFDERLRAGEEIDLAIRLLPLDVVFIEVPEAQVHYRYRVETSGQWSQAFENGRVIPYVSRLLKRTRGTSRSRVAGLRNWIWLVKVVPQLRDPVMRIRWRWVLASRCGTVAGCIRYRTVYL